jgi:hypothetical protein
MNRSVRFLPEALEDLIEIQAPAERQVWIRRLLKPLPCSRGFSVKLLFS